MSKEEFLKDIDGWCNHRELLWPALEATKHLKLPVLELGCGHGSTPFLQTYCQANGLELFSYDFNSEWAAKFNAIHVTNWETQVAWRKEYSVVLIDESPGEHRKVSLSKLFHAKIIVIHDSEPLGWNASNYQVRPLFDRFKYMKDLTAKKPEAWSTSLSNFIDVSKL